MSSLKSIKGMTLMELIVGMLLFAMVATTVSAVLVPMLKVSAKATELAECNTLLDNIANQIIKDLSNATAEIEGLAGEGDVLTDSLSITIDASTVAYTIDSATGALNKNGVPFLTKTYYKNKSVRFTCKPAGGSTGTAYTLTVIILSDKDEEMVRRDYAVQPLALNQYATLPS